MGSRDAGLRSPLIQEFVHPAFELAAGKVTDSASNLRRVFDLVGTQMRKRRGHHVGLERQHAETFAGIAINTADQAAQTGTDRLPAAQTERQSIEGTGKR